ncbi:MAG: FeoA family protein [Pseudomonadota bacterium]
MAMTLSESPRSTALRVTGVKANDSDDIIARRLMELGFIPGAVIEIRQEAPLLKDPMAILVRGMVVALRRYEADRVSVEPAR